MPEKDGAEEKSTKSVVNKRQKQMMGEEGYDIARDMGRVRPSKDKKDATTMPPSKEMKKTQKVNKGPSALDIVKKKYKGQIMDVKKEELDLTQVAKVFGGYIIESEIDDGFEDEAQKDAIKDIKKSGQKPPFTKKKSKKPKITGDVVKTTVKPADVQGRQDATDPKQGGYPRVSDDKPTQFIPTKTIGKMKVTVDKSIIDPKFQKTKPVKKVTPPEVKAATQDFGGGDKVIGKPTGDMDAEKYKVKVPEKPKRKYYKATKKSRKATPKEIERYKAQAAAADAKEKKTLERSKSGKGFVRVKRPERLPKDVFNRTR